MNTKVKKILIISFYLVFLIVLGFILKDYFYTSDANCSTFTKEFDSEIESLVKQFYEKTDNGDYEGLSNIVISGDWFSEKNLKNPEYHSLNKILEKDEFIDKTLKGFGENGWRIQVMDLDITNIEKISREALRGSFPRENELLDVVDKDKNIMELYLVEASGHRVAACGIMDFKRALPVIWQNNNWKVLLTGTPEYLDLLYRDHWFANLSF